MLELTPLSPEGLYKGSLGVIEAAIRYSAGTSRSSLLPMLPALPFFVFVFGDPILFLSLDLDFDLD